jgi:hypothetical protein
MANSIEQLEIELAQKRDLLKHLPQWEKDPRWKEEDARELRRLKARVAELEGLLS